MVQSIARMFDVLEALVLSNEELSLMQLQEQLQLPASTIHRLLQTMIDRGYVDQNKSSRHYGPGLKILEVAESAKQNARFNLGRIARQYLQLLTDESGETSNLVIRHKEMIVYVEQVPSPQRVRMFTEVGHHAPMYCTGAGKAILSRLSNDQVETYAGSVEFNRLTPRTLGTVEELLQEIVCVRQRGFAIDNEEFETGVTCVAAPVVDSTGHCIGAISVSGPTTRLGYKRAEVLGAKVKELSAQCSTQLGYVPAGDRD